jgi:hypothetical protein
MPPEAPLHANQIVVMVCLFLVAAIAILGGCLQMYLGQRKVGLPKPTAVWLGYLNPELTLPIIIVIAQSSG